MRKSFTATFEHVDPEPGFDGLAALKNVSAVTSGVRVAVTDVRVYYPSGFNSDTTNILGTQGALSLDRISAASGGTTVTPIAFDTNASPPGTDATFRVFPSSVTYVETFRTFGDAFSMGMTQAVPFQAQYRAPGICDANDHSGRSMESQDVYHHDSSVLGQLALQPIVLHTGEGIAVRKLAYGVSQAHHWYVVVKYLNEGLTFRYGVTDAGSPYCVGDPIWSLMCETGAKAEMEVYIVAMPDLGESNIPRFRLSKIGGLAEAGGTVVTPVAHDTANTLTEIAAHKGEFRPAPSSEGITINYHNYQGSPVTIAEQQKAGTLRQFMLGTIYTETASPQYRCYMQDEIWPGERRMASGGTLENDALWLNPGETLAVIGGGNGLIETSEASYVNVEMVGYIETPPVSQARARYLMGV